MKIRRENGLKRGQRAPGRHFFPTARSTPMRTHDGPVDTPQLLVERTCRDHRHLQALKDSAERSIRVPLIEFPPSRFARTELRGQIAPR